MPIFSTPMADIIARLKFHTTLGQTPKRMLDGWKFEDVPLTDVEGLKDLPGVRIYVPDVGGDYRPSRNESGTMKVRLVLATSRKLGLVEHLKGVELVMDALNYSDASGQVKWLAGSVKPWSWSTEDNFIVDTSINSQVSIVIEPKVVEIGKRRL